MCAGAGVGRIAELAVLRERERARGAREGESESERERMSLASADPTLAPQSRPEFTNYIDDEGRRRGAAITSLSRLKHVIAPTPVWRHHARLAEITCRNYLFLGPGMMLQLFISPPLPLLHPPVSWPRPYVLLRHMPTPWMADARPLGICETRGRDRKREAIRGSCHVFWVEKDVLETDITKPLRTSISCTTSL